MKKKGIIILIAVLLVLAGAAGAIYYVLHSKKASNEELVYATKISDLNGGYDLMESRYMGTVESQEVKGVNRDSDKKVKELYVKEQMQIWRQQFREAYMQVYCRILQEHKLLQMVQIK